MRNLLLVLSLVSGCLVANPAQADDSTKEKAETPEGVYFLPTAKYEPRILTIDERRFTLEFFGSLPGKVEGYSSSNAMRVALRYFNGERSVSMQASSAIIDGELWLAVFQPQPYSENRRWLCIADEMGLLGYSGRSCPPGHILWDWDLLTFTHTPLPFSSSRSKTLKGVQLLHSPTEKENPNLLPVFSPDDFKTLMEVFPDHVFLHQRPLCNTASMARVGVFAQREWELNDTLEILEVESDTAAFHSMMKKVLPGETTFQRCGYRRVGDVIIAPWSINLGPVGLQPAKTPAEDLSGSWVTETSKKPLQVNTVEADGLTGRFGRFDFAFGRPDYDELLGGFQYRKNDGPIHHRGIFENCMMGHADYPGHIFWFATEDGRIVRYVYPSTHGPSAKVSPANKLEIFQRRK